MDGPRLEIDREEIGCGYERAKQFALQSCHRPPSCVRRLEMVDALIAIPRLSSYHLLPSVRGDLLEKKLGRFEESAYRILPAPRRSRRTPANAPCYWDALPHAART